MKSYTTSTYWLFSMVFVTILFVASLHTNILLNINMAMYCRLITGFAYNHLIIISTTFVIEWNRTECFASVMFNICLFLAFFFSSKFFFFCFVGFVWIRQFAHFFRCYCLSLKMKILLRIQFFLLWRRYARMTANFQEFILVLDVCDTFSKSKHSGRQAGIRHCGVRTHNSFGCWPQFNWKIAIANLKFARKRKKKQQQQHQNTTNKISNNGPRECAPSLLTVLTCILTYWICCVHQTTFDRWLIWFVTVYFYVCLIGVSFCHKTFCFLNTRSIEKKSEFSLDRLMLEVCADFLVRSN